MMRIAGEIKDIVTNMALAKELFDGQEHELKVNEIAPGRGYNIGTAVKTLFGLSKGIHGMKYLRVWRNTKHSHVIHIKAYPIEPIKALGYQNYLSKLTGKQLSRTRPYAGECHECHLPFLDHEKGRNPVYRFCSKDCASKHRGRFRTEACRLFENEGLEAPEIAKKMKQPLRSVYMMLYNGRRDGLIHRKPAKRELKAIKSLSRKQKHLSTAKGKFRNGIGPVYRVLKSGEWMTVPEIAKKTGVLKSKIVNLLGEIKNSAAEYPNKGIKRKPVSPGAKAVMYRMIPSNGPATIAEHVLAAMKGGKWMRREEIMAAIPSRKWVTLRMWTQILKRKGLVEIRRVPNTGQARIYEWRAAKKKVKK